MDESGTTIDGSFRRGVVIPTFLWVIFCAGLTVQFFSPHLHIEHNAFVLSEEIVAPGAAIDPRALISRQRVMQATSAVLVLVAVAGLAIWYRGALSRSLTRTGA